jgi:tetratricopeptide (TPR) repeat protein
MAPDAVRLHTKLANVLWRTARRAKAAAAFRTALRLAGEGPRPLDSVQRAHLQTRLGRLELTELRYQQAAKAFDAAEELLGDYVVAGRADDEAAIDQWLELMIEGRANLYVSRGEPEKARAMLEQARPLLDAHGGPERQAAFYQLWAGQRILANRMQVDEEDFAALRIAIAAAEDTGEHRDKDTGYALAFLGWALLLRGDLATAKRELTRALTLADRIGESMLRDVALRSLCLTALRQHDVERVRALLPSTFAAAKDAGRPIDSHTVGSLAISCWLAWQDGQPDEVLRQAAEVEARDLIAASFGIMYKWVHLFPVIAVQLQAGELAEAVAAATALADPKQFRLPDDLTTALAAAGQAWAEGDKAQTSALLTESLTLAYAYAYF